MGLFELFHKRENINQVYELMQNHADALLLDVRTAEEYAAGHLPQAHNLPLQDIPMLAQSLLPQQRKETALLVYCRSGVRSAQAVSLLRQMGYGSVHDLGGIISYKGELEGNG